MALKTGIVGLPNVGKVMLMNENASQCFLNRRKRYEEKPYAIGIKLIISNCVKGI